MLLLREIRDLETLKESATASPEYTGPYQRILRFLLQDKLGLNRLDLYARVHSEWLDEPGGFMAAYDDAIGLLALLGMHVLRCVTSITVIENGLISIGVIDWLILYEGGGLHTNLAGAVG
jgi:hypothetical protein